MTDLLHALTSTFSVMANLAALYNEEHTYRTVVVDGTRNEDAAWYYPEPKDAAREITDRVAFWKGVTVEEV